MTQRLSVLTERMRRANRNDRRAEFALAILCQMLTTGGLKEQKVAAAIEYANLLLDALDEAADPDVDERQR